MSRLTNADKHIIAYPPTPKTWRCQGSRMVEEAKVDCGTILPGSAAKCWLCGKDRPARPKLLWPVYLIACAKAGIDPDNPKGAEAAHAAEDSPAKRKPVRGVRRGR